MPGTGRLEENRCVSGKATNADALSEGLELLIRSQKVSLNHLAEFREDVEGVVAEMAAERATTSDITALESLLDEARIYANADQWEAFVELDKQIHQQMARITRNPIYVLVNQMVHDNIQRYYDDFLPGDTQRMAENVKDLGDLLENVRLGNAEDAKKVARRHVRRFNGYMQKAQQQNR